MAGIVKGKDIKLNVQPVTISIYHEYVFEGPCRFGEGEQLTKDYDLMRIAMIHKGFVDEVQEKLGSLDFINIMEPIVIKRDETFPVTDELLDEMGKDAAETDLYLIKFHPFGIDFALAFAQKYKKPLASVLQCCNDSGMVASLRPRGCEAYGWPSWEDAIEGMKVLRARKALANTRVLCVPRNNSNNSLSALDSFYHHDEVTERLGVQFRYYNLHEFMDQTNNVDPTTNPTLPGRRCDNINDEDEAEIAKLVDELMAGADECDMTAEDVFPSMKAHHLVNKLLEKLECNAFAAPCPDMCATRRLNENRFTLCLNHSLNNEQGICSACEYDLSALLSMELLCNLSLSAPYMGNTAVATYRKGEPVAPLVPLVTMQYEEGEVEESIAGLENVCYTFHATPPRNLKGFGTENAPYGLNSFAYSGWGATIRYDFAQDNGQVVTMCRFDPLCKKIFVCKGTIVGGMGYKAMNCSEGVFFQVEDSHRFLQCAGQVGNHIPLVYGDYVDDVVKLASMLDLEVITL